MLNLRNSKSFQSFFALFFVLFLIVPAQAQYSGGTGEPNNPYQIATAEDLMILGDSPKDYNKHFIMTADIDLAIYVFDRPVIAPINNLTEDTQFSGVFDGNYHTISNLNIQGYKYIGLFGKIQEGEVRNLGLIDVNIPSGGYAGGLAYLNKGAIFNCYSTGSVRGELNAGGLVGINHYMGTIKMCYSICNVTGSYNQRGNAGGLAGMNGGVISDSYSKGNVFGSDNIGGFVGINGSGSINRCYSTGQVTGYYMSVGGLIGTCNDINDISNSFWDIHTSGLTISSGGTGLTTTQLKDPNTFRIAGWDFIDQTDGPSDIWDIPETGVYPILWWQLEKLVPLPVFSGGSGTNDDPYLIATIDDLNDIGSNPRLMDKHFKLIQDLNIAYDNIFSIGLNYPFSGVFDGNGHIISNFKGKSDRVFNNVCPFYEIGHDGLIKNIGIEDVNIITEDENIGGLAGYNAGTITNSYTTGNIFSEAGAGGLVGTNAGTIMNCYSQTNLSGYGNNGGLVCFNNSIITSCYAIGHLTGSDCGGLVGSHLQGMIFTSFWDIETSGQTWSDGDFGSTGKTTAEMQTEGTFTDAGWDFVSETDNGTEDIWTICEGTNYPRFVWQISEGDLVCPDGIAMEDFDFFMDRWDYTNCDSSNNYCEGTDLDFSGTVDINDFQILIYNWLGENP